MICIVEALIYICTHTHTHELVCSCICLSESITMAYSVSTRLYWWFLKLLPDWKEALSKLRVSWSPFLSNSTSIKTNKVCRLEMTFKATRVVLCYTHLCRAQWPGLCNHPTMCYERKTPLPVFYSSPGPGTCDWTHLLSAADAAVAFIPITALLPPNGPVHWKIASAHVRTTLVFCLPQAFMPNDTSFCNTCKNHNNKGLHSHPCDIPN